MSATEMVRVLGTCLKGSRQRAYRVELKQARRSGRLAADPDEVYACLKERMMEDYEKPGPIPQGETVCRVGLLFTVLFRPVHQVRCPD